MLQPEEINPFTILRAQAEQVNLYGIQSQLDTGGDPGRISYAEAEAIREGIRNELAPYVRTVPEEGTPYQLRATFPPEELARRYDAGLQAGVIALGEGTLQGKAVSAFNVVAGTISSGWWQDEEHTGMGNTYLSNKAEAAVRLTSAVALLEHNFPPNNLGYRFDQTLGLWNYPRYVKDYLSRAYQVTYNHPGLFGDAETTVMIMEGIANRLELHRPVFRGEPVGREPFPRFTNFYIGGMTE